MFHHAFYLNLFYSLFLFKFGVVANTVATSSGTQEVIPVSDLTAAATPVAAPTIVTAPVPIVNSCVFTYATVGPTVRATHYAQEFSFVDCDEFKTLAKLFATVRLASVTITVASLVATKPGTLARVFYFGLAARGTAYKTGAVTGGVNPWLRMFVAGSTVNAHDSISYPKEPFPPGVQLDLKHTETLFKYPCLYVVNSNPEDDAKNDYSALTWRITMQFQCEGVAGVDSFRL